MTGQDYFWVCNHCGNRKIFEADMLYHIEHDHSIITLINNDKVMYTDSVADVIDKSYRHLSNEELLEPVNTDHNFEGD